MKTNKMLLAVLFASLMLAGLSGCVKEEFDEVKLQTDVVTIPADVDDWKGGEPINNWPPLHPDTILRALFFYLISESNFAISN